MSFGCRVNEYTVKTNQVPIRHAPVLREGCHDMEDYVVPTVEQVHIQILPGFYNLSFFRM